MLCLNAGVQNDLEVDLIPLNSVLTCSRQTVERSMAIPFLTVLLQRLHVVDLWVGRPEMDLGPTHRPFEGDQLSTILGAKGGMNEG